MDWNLEGIFDRIDGYVYLIDATTYEVLYVNGTLKKVLGTEVVGRSCFEVFQGRDAPCEFCPNERVFSSSRKAFSFEFYNPKLRRHFYCMDFALEPRENLRHKLEIAIDITRSKITRLALEGVVRLLLSLTHNYFANVEKILHFILEQWKGDEVAYRGRGGQIVVVSQGVQVTLPKEAWENIFDASLHKTRWRLKRGDARILVLRVDQNSFLGILKKSLRGSDSPKGTYFVVSRLLYLEEERRREELRWFRLFDRSPDPLFLVTQNGEIMESNTRASEVLGWNRRSLQNASVELIFGQGIWQTILERTSETPSLTMELEVQNLRGEPLSFEARLSPFGENDEKFYLLSLRDIGERKRYESVLLRFALYDQLTGLYNRRFLEEYLSKELERCKREGYALSVAFADVNAFKKINDVYGHVFGDEVLKMVAETMQKTVRASDVVARYGGDEFVLVLPRASESDALQVMERIAKNLRTGQIQGEPFSVRISYGVYAWDREKDILGLFKELDRRMYQMKRGE